ncbi:ABC transporter ATP-binding protein [candidate division KSB1 bacterium]|nr:ABC transporter ATP-binding protein [candidate division KSB1 bacterium]
MDQKNILLKVENLKIQFKQRHGIVTAVEDVSFQIQKGSIIGMVGESGCGKSVTSRALLRLEAPGYIERGKISYYPPNRPVVKIDQLAPRKEKIRTIRWRDISMIFQEPMTSLGAMHSIGNQVGEAIRLHLRTDKKTTKRKVIESLRSVGLPRPEYIAKQYPHQLSGGMRQRVMIAMALSCNPNLLIADEPTTALDVTTEAQILDLLLERQQALGMAVLYITHNLAVISKVAEKIIVMYLGRIIEEAASDVLFYAPKHPYTRALLRAMPKITAPLQKKLSTIAGEVPDPIHRPFGCTFHPRCTEKISGLCDRTVPPYVQADDSIVACHLFSKLKND